MTNRPTPASWQKRWNRSLLRFLGRCVHTTVDIELLARETYSRLLRARELGELRNPQAYLLRVASHLLAEWRDNSTHSGHAGTADDNLLIEEGSPPLQLEASISQERLDHTLKTVSPTVRAVLLLRLRDDRSCKDIAQELDITVRQVRRYLACGYEKLRAALEN
jgi:RNA polymerase sigma factor (sigma-70 family)